jgi:hypothetical protein
LVLSLLRPRHCLDRRFFAVRAIAGLAILSSITAALLLFYMSTLALSGVAAPAVDPVAPIWRGALKAGLERPLKEKISCSEHSASARVQSVWALLWRRIDHRQKT